MTANVVEILMVLNGLLLAVVGFFVKNLVTKVDDTRQILSNVDKALAVMGKSLDNHEREFKHFYLLEENMTKEIKDIRERLHFMGNDINKLSLRCGLNHEEKV